MKNYIIRFMDKSFIAITAQEAAIAAKAWQGGANVIFLRGSLKATHQITSIDLIDAREERELCEIEGIDCKNPPRIENFLSDKKLLK